MEVLREEAGPSNRHILIVGPRGVGKTTLVRRVVSELQTNPQLASQWYPIAFAEESYEVSSPGELWLLALFHLANQTNDRRWYLSYEDLKKEPDEMRLRERALAQLMDFAHEQGTRILLIVENLNMLVGDQLSRDDAWVLRHTLLNEPRLMMLASATTRFEAIENVGHAWYEIFEIYDLKPLDDTECRTLWTFFTGEEPPEGRIRPIQILTGGNPRLISVLATFARDASFRELMDNLIQLIDDHTEYFKSQLDGLSPTERKVFVTLLDLWDPATAQQVSRAARIHVSKASALLGRLVSRGAVAILSRGRKNYYQAAERLYNIYYLMRRRGSPSQRVHAVVAFMVQFYEGDQLISKTAKLAEEACQLQPDRREDLYWVYEDILKTAPRQYRSRIIKATPKEFFTAADMPHEVRQTVTLNHVDKTSESDPNFWVSRGDQLSHTPETFAEAENSYRKALEIDCENYVAWYRLGLLYGRLNRIDEAEEAYRNSLKFTPESSSASAKAQLALGLLLQLVRRHEEAEAIYRQVARERPELAMPWVLLGDLKADELSDYETAEGAYRKAIEIAPQEPRVLIPFGQFLVDHLNQFEEAERIFKKVLEIDPNSVTALTQLGKTYIRLDQHDNAEQILRRALALNPTSSVALSHLADTLHLSHNDVEALSAYEKVVELDPDDVWPRVLQAHMLYAHFERYEEAEQALRQALTRDPKFAEAWSMLGELFAKLHRYDEAEESLRKAAEVDPDSATAWCSVGDFLREYQKRNEDAEQAYLKAIEFSPKYSRAWSSLADLYETSERFDAAEEAYRRVTEIEPNSYRAWANLGHFLDTTLERYREGEEAYLKAIELNPDVDWVWAHLGKLLYVGLNRPKEAEQAFRKAIELKSNDWTWTEFGRFLEHEGRSGEAKQAYQKALEANPNYGRGWLHLGELLYSQFENNTEAEEALQKAVNLDTESAKEALIRFYLTGSREAARAIEHARQYLKESGNSPDALNDFAWVFYTSGPSEYFPEAEKWARDAVTKSSMDTYMVHTLISILGAQGKWKETLELLSPLVNAAANESMVVGPATDVVISIAAAGFAKQALETIVNSAGARALEPLSAGLRLYIGEQEYVAKEIFEVGKDVAERIRERRASAMGTTLKRSS